MFDAHTNYIMFLQAIACEPEKLIENIQIYSTVEKDLLKMSLFEYSSGN